ncbi:carboxypeptidase-like regulatory domain-containing protein [Dyella mobilis]|uniref:Carboxypeptidase regulatory-like domain-containing protein n=1 Tax=Dyella mobilis TaxID=1849582 RepID=A0ABS2KFF6_9GAMM|nr:carboxypeptidase-like regulatory domain-containing protein [Dyella mobilis]MBM7129886.1 carboxypeptidase regulatory-like domain-containing protein [Dyella mobilis]GLQ97849.1 hypothetical protein GCM10007863_22690 [Dyella mobilis]
MGAFDQLVLFSEVRGTVLIDGRPVQGAELVETAAWSGNKRALQRTVTDENGAFSLPAIKHPAGLRRIITAAPTVWQEIFINYQGVQYVAWKYGKLNYDINGELDGRPINLLCELTNPPTKDGSRYGICKLV